MAHKMAKGWRRLMAVGGFEEDSLKVMFGWFKLEKSMRLSRLPGCSFSHGCPTVSLVYGGPLPILGGNGKGKCLKHDTADRNL
jgi:hypothetical protein